MRETEHLIQTPIDRVGLLDRPVLVVSIVSTTVIVTLSVLVYFWHSSLLGSATRQTPCRRWRYPSNRFL